MDDAEGWDASPSGERRWIGSESRRIHITGGPGSGKSRLARRLARGRSLLIHDLDGMLLATENSLDRLETGNTISDLANGPAWVSDGVYFAWAQPFIKRAQVIVWLDVPWRVASYRMIARHLSAELKRRNRFPGWRRFYSFWRWAARYYGNRNDPTLDRFGVPNTPSTLARELTLYRDKVMVCRTNSEVEEVLTRLSG